MKEDIRLSKCSYKKIIMKFISLVHVHTDKKNSKNIRKFREEQLQSDILLTASSHMGKYLRIASYIRKPFLILYMTLQLLYSEFPNIWGKYDFLFYQCSKCSIFPWICTRRVPSMEFAKFYPYSISIVPVKCKQYLLTCFVYVNSIIACTKHMCCITVDQSSHGNPHWPIAVYMSLGLYYGFWPETHTKRQATQHGGCRACLSIGTKELR
jgi:hypothetical protein